MRCQNLKIIVRSGTTLVSLAIGSGAFAFGDETAVSFARRLEANTAVHFGPGGIWCGSDQA